MDKYLKNIIEKVIDMENQKVIELNFSDMSDQEKAEHERANKKCADLGNELNKLLPKEFQSLFREYANAAYFLSGIEEDYKFNRGVKAGLTKLNFIREELGEAVIMLQENK